MKRVLLVPDIPNWAWWKRAKSIQKFAPDGIEVDVIPQRELTRDLPNKYDGTLVFSWPDSPIADSRVWTFVANEGLMYEHNPDAPNYVHRTASRIKNRETAEKRIPRFRGVITVNHRTTEFLKDLNPNTHCLRTGVDSDMFRPLKPIRADGPLRVGWCGKAFDDPKKWTPKGWHEIMLPLMKRFEGDDNIEFVVNRRDASDALSESEMVEWYNSIDLFLVTSCSDGGPSTLMEAMACGRPFVATDVGIVSETMNLCIADHCFGSGFLVPRWTTANEGSAAVSLFETAIREGTELWGMMGSMSRKVVETHYNWKDLAEQWLRTILT